MSNFCPDCGKSIQTTFRFCPHCGKSLLTEEPEGSQSFVEPLTSFRGKGRGLGLLSGERVRGLRAGTGEGALPLPSGPALTLEKLRAQNLSLLSFSASSWSLGFSVDNSRLSVSSLDSSPGTQIHTCQAVCLTPIRCSCTSLRAPLRPSGRLPHHGKWQHFI